MRLQSKIAYASSCRNARDEQAVARADELEARLREVQEQSASKETPRDVATTKSQEALEATVESLREQLVQKDKDLLAASASRRPARQQRGGAGFCGAKPKKH